MTCPDSNALAQLVDGTLADRGPLEAHLDACDACTELFAQLAHALPDNLDSWLHAEPRSRAQIDVMWRRAIAAVAKLHPTAVAPAPDRMFIDGDDITVIGGEQTLPFRALEILRGGRATPASDQFALCVGWWQARTGVLPFRGATPGALAVAIEHRPEQPANVDREWYVRVVRGLAMHPASRWPDLDALLRTRVTRPRHWIIPVALVVAGAAALWIWR